MLKFTNLTLGYNRHPIVHHLNAAIAEGDSVAIIGPNGGGKSTLLKAIMSIIRPLEGSISCAFERKNIAYLPQGADINKSFPISTEELLSMGLWNKNGWFKRFSQAEKHAISHTLQAVGLKGMENNPINTLSGGQIQRALFARLILQDASLILLDEPFNAVDVQTTKDLMGIVRHWQGEQRTIIAVLHNYEQVKELFSKTLILARETVAFGPTSEVLNQTNIDKAFRTTLYTESDNNTVICHR